MLSLQRQDAIVLCPRSQMYRGHFHPHLLQAAIPYGLHRFAPNHKWHLYHATPLQLLYLGASATINFFSQYEEDYFYHGCRMSDRYHDIMPT